MEPITRLSQSVEQEIPPDTDEVIERTSQRSATAQDAIHSAFRNVVLEEAAHVAETASFSYATEGNRAASHQTKLDCASLIRDKKQALPASSEKFLLTQLNPRCTVQELLAGSNLSMEAQQAVSAVIGLECRETSRLASALRHAQANHRDIANRAALLSQRPDLPVDRIPAYAEMGRLQQEVHRLTAALAMKGRGAA
jgi:hypothetical protein